MRLCMAFQIGKENSSLMFNDFNSIFYFSTRNCSYLPFLTASNAQGPKRSSVVLVIVLLGVET